VKFALFLLCLALVYVSFAGGQRLRDVVVGPIPNNTRVSALPEAFRGNVEVAQTPDQEDENSPAETFREVLRYVKSEYVERIEDDTKLGFGAVRAMLVSLDDPKTRFLEPAQRKQLENQINGQFTGIGAVVSIIKRKRGDIEERRLGVVAPAPGGPADKAGLRAGDIITEIDGHWVIAYDPRRDLARLQQAVPGSGQAAPAQGGTTGRTPEIDEKEYQKALKDAAKLLTDGITLPKALEQITMAAGKKLTLTLERPGAQGPIKVTVDAGPSLLEPVLFKALNDRVAYLRVTQFNDRATEAFTSALTSAKQKALILDLRDNAGGPVTDSRGGAYHSALTLLGRLTKGGQVALVVRKGARRDPIKVTPSGNGSYKIAVLVNRGTANLAEMVAAALKEKAGAVLIGGQTFGDATMQKLVGLRNGAALTLSTGKFLTAGGLDFSKGLKPDVPMSTSGPRASDDPVVERAVNALTGA